MPSYPAGIVNSGRGVEGSRRGARRAQGPEDNRVRGGGCVTRSTVHYRYLFDCAQPTGAIEPPDCGAKETRDDSIKLSEQRAHAPS